MNKRLWQAIGLEKRSSELGDFSECSTIKVEDCSPLNDVSEEIRLFASQPTQGNYFRNHPKNPVPAENDLDIESCSSLSESPKFLRVEHKTSKITNKIRIIGTSVLELREGYLSLREEHLGEASRFRELLRQQIQQLTNKINEKLMESKCCRCETNKKMIDALTNQCWELEKQLKEGGKEKARLSQQLLQKESPLRQVEMGLLEERGQTIRRLRAEAQELTEQNRHLKISFSSMEEQLNNVQNEYKKHLLDLKINIQELNELASTKHEKLLQDKLKLEGELEDLGQKYHNLLINTDRSSKSRQKKRSRSKNGTFSYTSLAIIDKTPKQTQMYAANAVPTFNTSMKRCITEAHQNFQDLRKNNSEWKTQSAVLPLSFSTKCENVLNKYNLKRNLNRTYCEGSTREAVTMKVALDSLADLKREVRRQIKKSKFY